jgi:hypothetical protein
MKSHFGSAGTMRKIAAALLGLALAAIGAMHYAGQRTIAIQGPGALQAMGEQALWLGVNDDLWVLDARGTRIARKSAAELGLTAAVSNIVPAPDGQALLTSRADTSWQVVNRADLSRVRTIKPQWPAQFVDHSSGAIHVAVSPDWDIAVATGGGHAVLLFDGSGAFKGRSAPGLYHFTNGLWHSPDGWWTTDTNSFKLRLLDTKTLALKDTVDLRDNPLPYAFLGELAASHGVAQAGTGQPPLATVSRVGFLMEPGHVVDVFPDGSQAFYNREPLGIVRDIGWFNDQLLVIDGARYEIARFSAQRDALPRFGDAAVTAELDAMQQDRLRWTQLSSRSVFLPAALLLVLGVLAYNRSKTLARNEVIEERPPFMVGTPAITRRQAGWQWAWVVALPYLLRFAFIFALLLWWPPFTMPRLAAAGLVSGFWAALLTQWLLLWLPLLAWMSLERHRFLRVSANPAREAILNRRAVAWLGRFDDFDAIRQPGESPRETVLLLGWRPRWLLVTNRRILLFAAGARERRLVSQWPRNSVVHTAGGRPRAGSWLARGWQRWFRWRVNLQLRFRDGSVLEGFAASDVTARRVRQLLAVSPAAASLQPDAGAAPQRAGRRWHEVIASALVPGLGQLLQDRFASGAVLLTAAGLLFLGVLGPVLWASSGPKMDVSLSTRFASLLWWLLLAGAAAIDAWHFSAAQRRRARA